MKKLIQLYLQYIWVLFRFKKPILYTMVIDTIEGNKQYMRVHCWNISSKATRKLFIGLNSVSFECTIDGVLTSPVIPMDDVLFITGE